MKELRLTFNDADFRRLEKAKLKHSKGNVCWREFILRKCCKGVSIKL
jgi:hypothetical protein